MNVARLTEVLDANATADALAMFPFEVPDAQWHAGLSYLAASYWLSHVVRAHSAADTSEHIFHLQSAHVHGAHAISDQNERIWSDSVLEVRSAHGKVEVGT